MEKDIEDRINQDFGVNSQNAIVLIGDFETSSKSGARVIRCVIHLAKGDISKLKEMIKSAETDWRDVIMWAETSAFEFDEPFK